ncbi:MAG: ribonuclease HII [Candidatus Levyibacteriota bacterium]
MTKPDFKKEKKLWKKGYSVIGIDEVGRGAFAGPLVVGGVVFKNDVDKTSIDGINDSKLIKPKRRKYLSKKIREISFCTSTVTIPVSVINKQGIGNATSIGFRKVVSKLINSLKIENLKLKIPKQNIFVLVDGFHVKYIRGVGLKNQEAIIKGDQKSISIAAASIIAKVHRDKLMKKLHKKYPLYGFAKHKGYGTKEHQKAIKKYGLSKLHRKSFNLLKFTK